ncbi:MAG: AAA family ATPase [Nitrososphaerales archaeon]
MHEISLIVCITGMPGSGKTTAAEALKIIGFRIISMGDVIREEATRQGIDLNDINLGNLMIKLRKEHGPGAIASLTAQKIRSDRSKLVAIDGLRSVHEVDVLNNYGIVKVLAIDASKETRFRFLRERGRSDAPRSQEEFDARDKRELDVGVQEAISAADGTVSNDNITIKDLKAKVVEVVQLWVKRFEEPS